MPGATFIEGKQVDLKTVEQEDIEFLQKGRNHPSIARFMETTPSNREQIKQHFEQMSQGNGVHLIVVPTEGRFEGEPVGYVFIDPIDNRALQGMLGVWLLPEAQQNKYAQDALGHLVDHAFRKIGLHRLMVKTNEKNKTIQRMCERFGFTHEGTIREREFIDGEYQDSYVYGLLASEYVGLDEVLDSVFGSAER